MRFRKNSSNTCPPTETSSICTVLPKSCAGQAVEATQDLDGQCLSDAPAGRRYWLSYELAAEEKQTDIARPSLCLYLRKSIKFTVADRDVYEFAKCNSGQRLRTI